jgi:hypothetical protein
MIRMTIKKELWDQSKALIEENRKLMEEIEETSVYDKETSKKFNLRIRAIRKRGAEIIKEIREKNIAKLNK